MRKLYSLRRVVQPGTALLLFLAFFVIHSCRKDIRMSGTQQNIALSDADISELKGIYNSGINASGQATTSTNGSQVSNFIRNLNVKWGNYQAYTRDDNSQVAEFELEKENFMLSTRQQKAGDTVFFRNKTEAVFIKLSNGKRLSVFMKVIEDFNQTKKSVIANLHYKQIPSTFTGSIIFYTLDRHFINGWRYNAGQIVAKLGTPGAASANSTQQVNSTNKQVNVAKPTCGGVTVYWEEDCEYDVVLDDGTVYIYYNCDPVIDDVIPDICDDLAQGPPGGGVLGDTGGSTGGPTGTPPPDTSKNPCQQAAFLAANTAFKGLLSAMQATTDGNQEFGYTYTLNTDGSVSANGPSVGTIGSASVDINIPPTSDGVIHTHFYGPTNYPTFSPADIKALFDALHSGDIKNTKTFSDVLVTFGGTYMIKIIDPVQFAAFAANNLSDDHYTAFSDNYDLSQQLYAQANDNTTSYELALLSMLNNSGLTLMRGDYQFGSWTPIVKQNNQVVNNNCN